MNKYKAIALALLLSLGAGSAMLSAQEEGEESKKTSKREFTLPAAGDIQLGIDVAPILRYVGNMFNGNVDNNTYNEFGSQWIIQDDNPVFAPTISIMGKYMITDNMAVRANIGILTRHEKVRAYSLDDAAYALNNLSEAKVLDLATYNTSGAAISLGAEYRRGYRWIQGIFGGDLIYGFSNMNAHYQYGNALTDINQTPSRNFTTGAYPAGVNTPTYWTRGYLLDHYNNAADQYVGLDIRVGVECFMTSYFAIGGEVTLAALWKIGAPEYVVHEGFNTHTNQVEQRTETITPGNTTFEFGTRNLGGKLYLAFYF